MEFQFMSLRSIEVLACSFDTDFNYFDNNLCKVNIEKSSTKIQKNEISGKDYLDVEIIRK